MKPSTATEKNIAVIVQSVQRGDCCRVLGPRRTNKSQLMRRAARTLKADEMHYVAYISLNDILPTASEDFFFQLFTAARHALPEGLVVPAMPSAISSPADFQYLLTELIRHSDRNLALFVDDLEIAPPNLAAKLLGILRAIYMTLIDQPGARLQAIVCSSVAFSRLALNSASPFEGISVLVRVGDLDRVERVQFIRERCHITGYTPMARGVNTLLEFTAGDRVLIKAVLDVCFEQMTSEGRVRVTSDCITRAKDEFLRRPLPPAVVEQMRQVEGDADLLTCTLMIMEYGAMPSQRLPLKSDDSPSPLDLCGLFRFEDDAYTVKSLLWEWLLHDRLTPGRIGGIYGVTAQWDKAMEYLGIAIRQWSVDIRPRLYATTINAIYASHDLLEIFGYLGRGLEAAFPGADVILYNYAGRTLELLYASVTSAAPRAIAVDGVRSVDVEALDGPGYSVTMVDGVTRWLVPLRGNGRIAEPTGLVSLQLADSAHTHFRQREELQQLSEFLTHAGQAIERRRQHISMLARATERTEELNALNHVLKRILDDQHRDPEMILRMMMVGITARPGLAFSRAIFFSYDTANKQLQGDLAIGARTAAEANQARDSFAIQAIDTRLNDLAAGEIEDNPLQVAIRPLTIPVTPDSDNLFAYALEHDCMITELHGPMLPSLAPAFFTAVEPPLDFVILPVGSPDRRLGLLYVDDKFSGTSLDHARIELLQTFARQASVLIENVQMYANLVRSREQEHRERIAKMATGLVHDLRSEIANIPDLVTEIEVDFRAGEDITAPLQDLRNYATDVDRIGRKLRDFIFTGKFFPKRFNVSELIRRTILSVGDQRPDHVTIDAFLPADSAHIEAYADELWIELLLKNLLLNACQAADPREEGRVSVTVEQRGDLLSLRVQDNGSGISPENLDLIFEPGFTTKIDHGRSLGIGLYHCQLIATTHGGAVVASSKPGIGTEFEATFLLEE